MKQAIEEEATIKANKEAEKKWSQEVQTLQDNLAKAESNIEKAKTDANKDAEKAFSTERNTLQKQLKQAQNNEEKAKKEIEKAQKLITDIAMATSIMKVTTIHEQIVNNINLFKKAIAELQKVSKEDAEKYTANLKTALSKF